LVFSTCAQFCAYLWFGLAISYPPEAAAQAIPPKLKRIFKRQFCCPTKGNFVALPWRQKRTPRRPASRLRQAPRQHHRRAPPQPTLCPARWTLRYLRPGCSHSGRRESKPD
jgi:hypothetical protein